MAIPIVSLDFCSEPVNLHCPVCGQLIFALGVHQQNCHHVIFLGDSASGRWSWQQGQYAQEFNLVVQQKYAEVCKNGFYGSLDDYIATIGADKSAAIAAETTSRKSLLLSCHPGGLFAGKL
ncbi:MAG: hypothetical protein IMY82_08720 [Chloroflexi bacterium]|nr:hypothetical protein [Chloroflexota bacterium]